ncbi:MAG TPA: ion channel [Nocardioidaceae bacterium]|nr:ion channel [Nocardioidaceae bacterium]
MPVFLSRVLTHLTRVRTWVLPVSVVSLVFVTSWPLMAWAEPDSNPIADPGVYWWWFVVTASTVGYGDYFPETVVGHLVGVYVIVGGIATLTTLFARLAELIESAKGRRMKGQIELDLSGHLVILGYSPGRTERMVDELTAEGRWQVVLCAWHDVESDPLPGRDGVHFVRGDLTEEDVLRRACVDHAEAVLVDARDDNEALALTVASTHVNPHAHTVVTLRDMDRARNLSYVDDSVRCVQWHSLRMVTEELQDPGISQIYADLMTHGGGNTYSTEVPETLVDRTFGEFQQALGLGFRATVLAARADRELLISPDWATPIAAGTTLYYVAERRLDGADLEHALHH